ncbi:UNVERIFIED_CONTAM: hypothetical protein HDU68_003997 [Siphonaria sp. JEL0065]|nr:hypothetical protein HDU68_003997 [Siphonaria sp. JEL0065]
MGAKGMDVRELTFYLILFMIWYKSLILILVTSANIMSETTKTPLALPYTPQEGAPEGNGRPSELSLGGSVTLDHLGPIVVGIDGSMQRITNWETLTEAEKKNTVRVVAKRNKARLEQLAKNEIAVDLVSALHNTEQD